MSCHPRELFTPSALTDFSIGEIEYDLFEEKPIISSSHIINQFYIGFLDWGDGSKIEYDTEPFSMGLSKIINHTYEKSGVYNVKGTMFRTGNWSNFMSSSNSEGISHWKEFNLAINIGGNPEIEEEYKLLGGLGYDFIPRGITSPIISGISENSLYYKALKHINGFYSNNIFEVEDEPIMTMYDKNARKEFLVA